MVAAARWLVRTWSFERLAFFGRRGHLTLGGAGGIVLNAPGAFNIASMAQATAHSGLSGSVVTEAGAGTLMLAGGGTYTNGTTFRLPVV